MTEAWVVGVIFFATLIRSSFGFGEALIAVPLLSLLIPVEIAAPVAVLFSITVALVVVLQDWRHIHVRSAARLVISTLLGIPLGLLFLTALPDVVIKAVLGATITAFAVYCLARRTPFALKDDRHAWLFGFAAGILGGAYGMNGPPLVVYGTLRRWTPEQFRATLQGYFLPASAIGMAGYGLTGFWVPAVNYYFLIGLPLAVAAIFLGRVVNRRLNGQAFVVYLYVGLVVIGVILLAQSLASGA